MHELDHMIEVIVEAYINNEITFEEKEILLESLKDKAIEKGKAGWTWATGKIEKGTRAVGKAGGKALGNVTNSDAIETIKSSSLAKGAKAVATTVAASTAARTAVDVAKKIAKSPNTKNVIKAGKFAVSTPAFALSIVSAALGSVAASADVTIKAMTEKDLTVFNQWSNKMTKWAGAIKTAVFAGLKAPTAGPVDWLITAAFAVQVSNFAFDHDGDIKKLIDGSIDEIKRQFSAFEEEFKKGLSEADAEKRLRKAEERLMKIEKLGSKLAAIIDGTKFIKSKIDPNTSKKKRERRIEANKQAKKAMKRELASIRESMAFDKLDATIFEGSEISSYGYKVLQTMCTTLESTDDFDVEYIVESYLDID